MTELSIGHYRGLLSDLKVEITERVRAEQALADASKAEGEPSAYAFEETLRGLDDEFRKRTEEADARHAAEREELHATFQAELTASEREHERVTVEVRRRVFEELAGVEQQYAENAWMLSSLLDDDSENSPKRHYEQLNEQLQQARERLAAQWETLNGLYEQAVAQLEERRQRTDSYVEATPPARTRKEALEGFDTAAGTVRSGFGRLERQVLPRLFAGWTFVLLGISLWGGLFAAGYLLVDPQALGQRNVTPAGHVLLSGGLGFAITALALMALWGIASRQTGAVFGPMRQGMTDAQAHHQTWLKLARDELQRSERQYREQYDALVERRDRAARRFQEERDVRTAALNAELERGLSEPARLRDEAVRDASMRLNRELLASELAHRRETTALRTRLGQERERLTRERSERSAARDARQREIEAAMKERWSGALARLTRAAAAAKAESETLFPDWAELLSQDWQPPGAIPPGVRIGELELDLAQVPGGVPADPRFGLATTRLRLPGVLTFPDSPSLVLKAAGTGREVAVGVLQVAMLRLLTLLPPGKLRFTIIDPVGLGENFAAFMHLADYDELLISGRIWTEPGKIEQQLGDLTEHMENVFQKYLRDEFETIEEYNEHAGEVAEPYRVLVVANFPAGFSERAAQRLTSIAASGRRCGVYALVSVDTKQAPPHGFDLANIEAAATVFRWLDQSFVTEAAGPDRLTLRPDAAPSPPQFAAIVKRIGELSRDVRRVEVPFRRVAPTEDALWTGDSRRHLECPLGRAGATKLQHLRLGTGTSQHALVAGKTGSGKSTLLHVLVTNLALRYSPDEVEFYLIDFKKGVEFKTYATNGLPHARVIAIESDREFGVSVLERLDATLKERGDRFREAGVQDIAAFRDARPDVAIPRILLVVDEFQEFFTEDDRYAQTASLLLDRLVRQGRAFGVHVLLGSQTLGGAYSLARATIGQMAVRIALQCGESDASLILSEENSAARLLTRPGEAIYNDANGMVEGNSPFQVAWLGDEERDEWLKRIAELARRRGFAAPSPVVFEGNVPANPARNVALRARLRETIQAGAPTETMEATAWIGESVAITGPTSVRFRRQSGANLLLVGQDPPAALGILSACAIGLGAAAGMRQNGGAKIRILAAGGTGNRWNEIAGVLPQPPEVAMMEAVGTLIAELAEEIGRRRTEPATPRPASFLLIDDLSRFRDLRRSDDDFGFAGFDRDKTPSASQKFAEVLREGPAVGVHVIAWCDSYSNAERWLGRALLREFEMRVAFQMGGSDSSNLIDSPAASRLGPHRALFFLDERGTTEKFRPYGPPTGEWLAQVRRWVKPEPAENLDIDEWVVV